jgi:hypothetical protein
MRNLALVPALALSIATSLGCGEEQSPTVPADPPALSLAAGHVKPLSFFFTMGGEPSDPFVLQAGLPLGTGPEDLCSGSFPPGDIGDVVGQLILTPPGGGLFQEQGREANFVVYQYGAGIPSDPCQLVGAPILGTGTGNFTFNLLDTGPGAFVAHVTARGTIDLVSGGQARVLGIARVVVRPNGALLFDSEQVTITPL